MADDDDEVEGRSVTQEINYQDKKLATKAIKDRNLQNILK